MPTSTAASSITSDIRVTSVAFTPTGAVRLRGSYQCPLGYELHQTVLSFVQLFQPLRYRTLEAKKFLRTATCDGTRHAFSKKFPAGEPVPPTLSSEPGHSKTPITRTAAPDQPSVGAQAASGSPFRRNRPMYTIARLSVTNGTRNLDARDYEMTRAEARWAAARIADAEFTPTGVIRLTVSYLCPDGFEVRQPDRTIAAVTELDVAGGHSGKHFDRRVVCDATWNQVRLRFRQTRSGDPFQPGLEYLVEIIFYAFTAEASVYVDYAETRIIDA
jgi:hypothetical protein